MTLSNASPKESDEVLNMNHCNTIADQLADFSKSSIFVVFVKRFG